ncbi:FMN-binding glutamate synthase family protein [Kytococcus schroeteri]|uniref:FMN-binding glutamate synthase family protein n=1 Tax=Kytococcus schroeteri TaxID=138300 RepID=UPI00114446DD|nr:FMN-binding glutamate synthase family protein [Kytococcus schroeteri]
MHPIKALAIPALGLAGWAAQNAFQKKHAILRTFPVLGNARFALETIGPELRQYIVAMNNEERPFDRDERSWIYAAAKEQNTYKGFGTDNNVEFDEGWLVVKHRTFSTEAPPTSHGHKGDPARLPSAKVLGGPRGRRHAFRPDSIVNVSAMSYGSLSGHAVQALNNGVRMAGAMQNTGEGGLSEHHKQGGDLIYQVGTGYFGCRDEKGRLSIPRLVELTQANPVRAIEIKLSQGAKPGLGGMLPGEKVTPEIAAIRGVPVGEDVASPSRHSAFRDVDSMLDVVEEIAEATGLPVGIKAAIGEMGMWEELADRMIDRTRGVDFITVDGGEGGTGAAPLLFSDHVALPFRLGFARVYSTFARAGITDDVTFIGAGKLGLPANAIVAMAMGADMLYVAREAMMSVGCIQAQKCHTGGCPTGVATQNKWLERGLDVPSKSLRAANYIRALRAQLLKLSEAVGVPHPGFVTCDDLELMWGTREGRTLREIYGYELGWGGVPEANRREVMDLMHALTQPDETDNVAADRESVSPGH